jgi:Ca2+-binding RTX toxin-like protein
MVPDGGKEMAIINGTSGDDVLNGTPNDDTISGFGGNDVIRGFAGNDSIDGGDGHDLMRGGDGNDLLIGGIGDDYLDGGVGDDTLDGGDGWDRATYGPSATGGVVVDLRIQGVSQNTGQGVDTLIGIEHLSGTAFADILTGTDGVNWLWGEDGDDQIFALGGDDLVEVGAGNVVADGGDGNDSFSVFGNGAEYLSPVTVSLLLQGGAQATGIGAMTITGFENLSGSAVNDTLTGDGTANVLAGDTGDDLLQGGAGNDTLYGDGRIIVDTHDTGGSGPITTYADIGAAFVGLIDGNDTLDGGDGDDLLNGGGGTDTASYASATGEVTVNLDTAASFGAAGHDALVSIENVTGSAFNDHIRGDAGANLLAGGDGHDFMRGLGGGDTMLGGTGDDYLDGGLGDDTLDGGSGIDRVSFAVGATVGVTVNLNIAGAQATGHGNDTLISIEHVSGTKFNDVLTGDGGDNWLWGGSDNSGVTGNDTISAGGGNDLVTVGNGTHMLSGGTGTDTFGTTNDADVSVGLTLSLALQGAAQNSGSGMWNLSGFENLSGSSLNDALSGDNGNNLLAGSLGNDTLSGGAGDDRLLGDGAVTVDTHGTGGSGPIVTYDDYSLFDPSFVGGNDTLDGGKGNDVLVGGRGDDMLTGGQGDDIFIVGLGTGDDRITDMAKKDLIAIVGVAGVDDFSDLTIVNDASGKNAVVSWGTGDSVTIEGMKANKVSASMFAFTDPSAAAAAGFAAFDLHHGHGGDMLVPVGMLG